jgi:hypothetical protein
MRWIAALLALFCFSLPAYALSKQDSPTFIPDKMPPLPKVKEGVVPWQMFQATQEKQKRVNFPSGGYSFEVTPIFSDKLKELKGKEVMVYGFMFPLEQSEKQTIFLIGPYPPSCPFHYHLPPSLIVEVRAKTPMEFSWDAVTVKGILELPVKDQNAVFYIVKDAVLVK